MKIYVLMGSTGEYSDRDEWPVRAYRSQDAAERVAKQYSDVAREGFKRAEAATSRWNGYKLASKELQELGDPHARMDYTGTTYYCFEVDLV